MLQVETWAALAARIIAGTFLVLLSTLCLRKLIRSAVLERRLWQASLCVSGLLLICDVAGLNLTGMVKRSTGVGGKIVPEIQVFKASAATTAPAGDPRQHTESTMEGNPPREVLWPLIVWASGVLLLVVIRLLQSTLCLLVRCRSQRAPEGDLLNRVHCGCARASAFIIHPDIARRSPSVSGLQPSGCPTLLNLNFP
jgi:hypothetical protein